MTGVHRSWFSRTGLAGFRLKPKYTFGERQNWIVAQCGFSRCMIRTMASSGQESESLNSQFLGDSMPTMITPLGLTANSITSTDVGSNTWAFLCTTCPSGSVGLFAHREVEQIVAKWRACLATGEKFG
jgi:hypothetical protein